MDLALTIKFWFTKSSGHLGCGKQVHLEWEIYNVSRHVDVKEIEPDKQAIASTKGLVLVNAGLEAFGEHDVILDPVVLRGVEVIEGRMCAEFRILVNKFLNLLFYNGDL